MGRSRLEIQPIDIFQVWSHERNQVRLIWAFLERKRLLHAIPVSLLVAAQFVSIQGRKRRPRLSFP